MKQKILDFIKGAWVHGLIISVVGSITETYYKFTTPPVQVVTIAFQFEYGGIIAGVAAIGYCLQHWLIPSTSAAGQYDLIRDSIKTTLAAISVYLGGMAANGITGTKGDWATLAAGCWTVIIAHVWATLKTASTPTV